MGVKVIRDRPDQRRHHRVTAPLLVTLEGVRCRTADWSLGGLRIEGFKGRIPAPGEDITLRLGLPFQGFTIGFPAKGVIVRSNADTGTVALRFTELSERATKLMTHFLSELIHGSMAEVEETIQRIDVPVTPVSTAPPKDTKSDVPFVRLPMKTLAFTAFYIVFGIIVFGYAALLVYGNVFRMEVETAVVSAPLETVRAPSDGRVIWAGLKPGDKVDAGELVLEVEDNELEKELDLADIEITARKARLAYLKRRQADELDKLEDFAAIDGRNVKRARAGVSELAVKVRNAEAQYKRLRHLKQKGFTTDAKLGEAEVAMAAARKELANARLDLDEQASLAEKNIGERHYTGSNFVGARAELDAEIRLAEHEIELAGQKHQALVKHRQRLAVHAPFAGIVHDLPRVNGGTVRRGDVIAIIEQPKARSVIAYLTQDEVLRVGRGDQALVYVPSLDYTLDARVARIDRTDGFVDEQNERYSYRTTRDRTAKVELSFLAPALTGNTLALETGTPVIVVFPSRSTNPIIAAAARKLELLLTWSSDEPPAELIEEAEAPNGAEIDS